MLITLYLFSRASGLRGVQPLSHTLQLRSKVLSDHCNTVHVNELFLSYLVQLLSKYFNTVG